MTIKILAPSYYERIKFIVENAGSGTNLLNVGCGDGYVDSLLKDKFEHIYGIDINRSDIEIARVVNPEKNVTYEIVDATKLPFSDDFFDVIVCAEVLEHIKKDTSAVSELHRVLKKDGLLIVSVPHKNYNFSSDPINYLSEIISGNHFKIGIYGFGHLRLYSERDIRALLKKFRNIKIEKKLHFFAGLFENSYLLNILQPLVKSDPKNLKKSTRNKENLIKKAFKEPPKILERLRDLIILIDASINLDKNKSYQLLIRCEK